MYLLLGFTDKKYKKGTSLFASFSGFHQKGVEIHHSISMFVGIEDESKCTNQRTYILLIENELNSLIS